MILIMSVVGTSMGELIFDSFARAFCCGRIVVVDVVVRAVDGWVVESLLLLVDIVEKMLWEVLVLVSLV